MTQPYGFPQMPQAPTGVPTNYTPPAAAPAYTPPVYQPPPVQAPPAAAPGYNPYAGADAAQVTVRTPNIQCGRDPAGNEIPAQHDLVVRKYERAVTTSGEFVFITFGIEASSVPGLAGTECAFKQNMNPNTRGGKNVAFAALKSVVFPIMGLAIGDPRVEQLCQQGQFAALLFECEQKQGANIAGRKVRAMVSPGTRKPNTPPDKATFPNVVYHPVV